MRLISRVDGSAAPRPLTAAADAVAIGAQENAVSGERDSNNGKKRRHGDQAKEEFRSLLVENAREILKQDGLEAVSIRNLTTRLGITPMAFYRYFDSKADVVQRLWASTFEALDQRVQAALEGETDPVQRLGLFLRCYLDHWACNEEAARAVFLGEGTLREGGPWDGLILENPSAQPILDLWRSLVRDALGSESEDEAAAMADLMFAQTLGVVCVGVLGRHPLRVDRAQFIEAALRCILVHFH